MTILHFWQAGYGIGFGNLLQIIRWGSDYFIACHISDNEFIAQIGNQETDDGIWEGPEFQTERKFFKLDVDNPGTEVVAETAAALAGMITKLNLFNKINAF